MSTRTESIHRLLAAEEEAQQIVNKARSEKAAKLKACKLAAEEEIERFKRGQEEGLQAKMHKKTGDMGANSQRLEVETEEQIQRIHAGMERLKGEFVADLVKVTTTV